MPHMLLIIEAPGQRATRSEAEGRDAYAQMQGFAQRIAERGLLMGGEALASTRRGKRVQGRGPAASVIDGPFAEAKEMVGGFFLIDTDSMDEALAIARDCPAAEWATVEVRPLAPCYDDSLDTAR